MTDQTTRRQALALLASAIAAASAPALAAKQPKPPAPPPGPPVVAIVGQAAALGFYEASRDGAQEAITEIGGMELVYVAPPSAVAKDQVQLVTDLIKRQVSAIIISPVDPTALALICRRAMARGIKVVSFEKPLPREARLLHLEATSEPLTAQSLLKMMAQDLKDGGEVGVLAGDSHGEEAKAFVGALIKEWIKPDYAKLKLAETVYGNVDDAKAYAATEALIGTHPKLRGVIAATPVCLAAAARCLADRSLTGKVALTGLGQPSQLKDAMAAQVMASFAIVNPVDLGYGAARLAAALIRNEVEPKPGAVVTAGRLGELHIGEGNVAVLGQPFVVDQSNFEKFSQMY